MVTWILFFSEKDIQAPFSVDTDADYYDDLRKRLTSFVTILKKASADEESIVIAEKYSDKVCEALRDYYHGSISSCHQKIQNLVKNCCDNKLAVASLKDSRAFPGERGSEIQFFRARLSDTAQTFNAKEMLHHPFKLRGKTGNYRFSIPGVTSLYLANSSYGCWIELGRPSEHDFNVSPFVLDEKQKIFNLAVMTRHIYQLHNDDDVHCWIKLLVLMIATSYRVTEKNRVFKSEYIVSQSIMLACKKLGFDGVAYFSKRVESELFAVNAINLALFADYRKGQEYAEICEHMMVDESLNYQLFRQLTPAAINRHYDLRSVKTGLITNIGNFKHQYSYKDTEFYRFDEHLFARWKEKENKEIDWGNALKE